MSNEIKKTFSDTYGKHALLLFEDEFVGSVPDRPRDVMHVLADNGYDGYPGQGQRLSPIRLNPDYVGRHRHGPGKYPVSWFDGVSR